jgi:hypothetical protein
MSESIVDLKSLRESLTNSLGSLCAQLRAALCVGIPRDDAREAKRMLDPDFEGWLRSDPAVTKNPASRYGDRTPGYITGNGLGSMQIGAADD